MAVKSSSANFAQNNHSHRPTLHLQPLSFFSIIEKFPDRASPGNF
jgi:hypothetical protein